jgi:hypothetical protein
MSDDPMPRYAGPRALAEALSAFARASAPDAPWNREGLRDDSEYRTWASPRRPAAAWASSISGR